MYRLIVLLLVGGLFVLLTPSGASANACGLDPRVPFAGHSFPLDGTAATYPYLIEDAYTNIRVRKQTDIKVVNDGTGRIFIIEKDGIIHVIEDDPNVAVQKTFLDITDRVLGDSNERGLLSLAFHPDYANNGYFYVYYSAEAPECQNSPQCAFVSRFSVSGDPDLADELSELRLIEREHNLQWHYAGNLHFGVNDPYLYISSGDATTFSPQNTTQIQGKILRIDVDNTEPGLDYAIPATNPFAMDFTKAREIYHIGVRNPWRFSFDRLNGDMWIGDVGASTWEEVNYIPAGTLPPVNLGWKNCEGLYAFPPVVPPVLCAFADHDPVFSYKHEPAGGFSVTGGFRYRGVENPELVGKYIFADFVTRRIWTMDNPAAVPTQIADTGDAKASAFAEKDNGDLLMADYQSALRPVWKIVPAPPADPGFPLLLSDTGLFTDTGTLEPAPGVIPYDLISPLWSDGAAKLRWIALPGLETIGFNPNREFAFPIGTVLIKHFELPTPGGGSRRVETRVMLHQTTGWIGYTYRWNALETDAEILLDTLDEDFTVDHGGGSEVQTWTYPSPANCLTCHAAAEGRILGVRTRQLNRDFAYDVGMSQVVENQLAAWDCLGLFDEPIQTPDNYHAYVDPADGLASDQDRARAYLATNCAFCHQADIAAPVALDMRFDALAQDMSLIGEVPQDDLGVGGALRIDPGSKETSTLWLRMGSTDPGVRMPKIGSTRVDAEGLDALGDWIDSLTLVDSDEDLVEDPVDSCPWVPNPAPQVDSGGIDTATPDGIGDPCQCLDLDGNGIVDATDTSELRLWLSGQTSLIDAGSHRRCVGNSAAGECSLIDAIRLSRGLAALAPAIDQSCPAATYP